LAANDGLADHVLRKESDDDLRELVIAHVGSLDHDAVAKRQLEGARTPAIDGKAGPGEVASLCDAECGLSQRRVREHVRH